VSGEGEGIGQGLYPSQQGMGSEAQEGVIPLPTTKCKLHAENVKFCAYFCVLLLFQHEQLWIQKFWEILFKLQDSREFQETWKY